MSHTTKQIYETGMETAGMNVTGGVTRRYTNGAFAVDMPRGCVAVMEDGGYAATGLKHCVRPMDMTGAAVQKE